MTSALIISTHGAATPPLALDLEAAGVEVLGETDCTNLLREVVKKAPDLVVCFQESPDAPFFESLGAVSTSAACPVVVFTLDPDAEKIATATHSGVHAYVVAGYGRNRLRSVMQLAQARFRHEQGLLQELADVRKRFDERKLVDRAKGILMGARQLREEEAFRTLRSSAMSSKRRIGQVSKTVIDSAHYAEAVNRAGQLRMLSQRIVKFYALACAGAADPTTRGMLADSLSQASDNLAILDRSLSKATFGDLLGAVLEPWAKLQADARSPPTVARLSNVDALAEDFLARAETLTMNLEIAAFATALRAVNVAGRQRMLTQRLAKEALMSAVFGMATRSNAATLDEFLRGFDFLDSLPLTNAKIQHELAEARATWRNFQIALADKSSASGRSRIAELSETLLGCFDRVTTSIERGVHVLLGI